MQTLFVDLAVNHLSDLQQKQNFTDNGAYIKCGVSPKGDLEFYVGSTICAIADRVYNGYGLTHPTRFAAIFCYEKNSGIPDISRLVEQELIKKGQDLGVLLTNINNVISVGLFQFENNWTLEARKKAREISAKMWEDMLNAATQNLAMVSKRIRKTNRGSKFLQKEQARELAKTYLQDCFSANEIPRVGGFQATLRQADVIISMPLAIAIFKEAWSERIAQKQSLLLSENSSRTLELASDGSVLVPDSTKVK